MLNAILDICCPHLQKHIDNDISKSYFLLTDVYQELIPFLLDNMPLW